ncbi:hypothetical protein BCR42DRAFT_489907 [Absidia repens]|uniref:Enoyl reductase (ER) domain-containing protein n=1 Tax=Absidia repens TaxID=90262 RepID=A0A1X2IL82_9FUNG|nr:hypothetical protein BCR42DRAFT_489907 [Absidia repens]
MVSVILNESPKPNSEFKYSLEIKDQAPVQPTSSQTLVNIQAAALNHRDVWILKGMYPGIVPGSVIGADAVGIVGQDSAAFKQGQRVLINPGSGWDKDERGPEGNFRILGLLPCIGTLTDTVAAESAELFVCPNHLSVAEAAALPLAGLTAYRALFTKGRVAAGQHVLITGIGGGVALFALQFAVAAGAHVYVTSSNPKKIENAIRLGAKGGVNYKDENCIAELKKLLNGNLLSAVIDGAAGPLQKQYPKVMRTGGIINLDITGSTMGSRQEFKEMVAFVDHHKIKPVVSRVWHGITEGSIDEAINYMKNGEQFGKLVIQISDIGSPQASKF